jgi:3-oxoadipate enol-lactonase
MNKTRVNDVELSYRDEGEGQAVVFLHAFPLNQSMWNQQVEEFSGTHRVITLDWPGFGNSGLSFADSTMPNFADVVAGLLDQLGIGAATICGLSMGGYAALAFCRKYPARVKALILCDTRAVTDTEEGKRGRFETAELVRNKGASAIVELMIPKLLGQTTLNSQPHIAERVRSMIEAANPEGVAKALIGMAGRDGSTDLLAKISCPTLVIVGEEDTLTPPSESENMHAAIPGSRLAVIPKAGHLANLELAAEFNRVVGDFLKRV